MMTTFSPSACAILARDCGLKLDPEHGLLFKGRPLDAAAVELGLSMAFGLQFERGDAERVLTAGMILAKRETEHADLTRILRDLDREAPPSMLDRARYAEIRLRWLPPRGL